jgi:hypothetical protein
MEEIQEALSCIENIMKETGIGWPAIEAREHNSGQPESFGLGF